MMTHGKKMHPSLIPGTYEYARSHGKSDFAAVFKDSKMQG